jgi:hypothetical protein
MNAALRNDCPSKFGEPLGTLKMTFDHDAPAFVVPSKTDDPRL